MHVLCMFHIKQWHLQSLGHPNICKHLSHPGVFRFLSTSHSPLSSPPLHTHQTQGTYRAALVQWNGRKVNSLKNISVSHTLIDTIFIKYYLKQRSRFYFRFFKKRTKYEKNPIMEHWILLPDQMTIMLLLWRITYILYSILNLYARLFK